MIEAAGAPARVGAVRALLVGIFFPLMAGAACVLGFAPFYLWQVPILAIGVLLHAWTLSTTPRQGAITGLAFGLGYFLAGVSWVYVSLHDFGSMPALLAALATFLFCLYLALFPAAAGWATVRLAGARSGSRLALGAAMLVLFEWLRGWLFTGFPWLNLGTSQVPGSPLAGWAPLLGAYGVSLAVTSAAALLLAVAMSRSWSGQRGIALAGFVALLAAGGAAREIEWSRASGPPISVALLQGNVAQDVKWRDEVRPRILEDYRRMIVAAEAAIVIIPETALPALLDQLPAEYVGGLREHARATGKHILLGTVERNPRGGDVDYYNSVVSLSDPAMPSYRKRHLVPFGEFIPPGFGWILAVLKIPMSDFARGTADQAALTTAGIPLGIAICYEDIFGEEVIDALPHAQLLVNVSNDAWFGRSFAAEQHLQFSQMRALETGRWMVRSTNTGVTAAIDPKGRVASRLDQFTQGTLVQRVEPRRGMTPYAEYGNVAAIAIAAVLGVLAWRRGRR